jgi:hypothetical protein
MEAHEELDNPSSILTEIFHRILEAGRPIKTKRNRSQYRQRQKYYKRNKVAIKRKRKLYKISPQGKKTARLYKKKYKKAGYRPKKWVK